MSHLFLPRSGFLIMLIMLQAMSTDAHALPVPAVAQEAKGEPHTPICKLAKLDPQPAASRSLPDLEIIRQFKLDSEVDAIAWSPDRRLLATSEKFDTVIKIWDVDTSRILHTISKQNKGNDQLIFTADGRYLITSSVAGFDGVNRAMLSIINVVTGEIAKNVVGPHDPSHFPRANVPRDFVLSPDGRLLFVAFNTRDFLIHTYDVGTWSDVESFRAPYMSMHAGPMDDELTIGQADGIVRTWSSSTKVLSRGFRAVTDGSYVQALALNKIACKMATGHGFIKGAWNSALHRFVPILDPEPIRVWDIAQREKMGAAQADAPIQSLEFSPDGSLLVAVDSGKQSIMYDADNLAVSKTIYRFKTYGRQAAFSSDGKLVAVAGDNLVAILALR